MRDLLEKVRQGCTVMAQSLDRGALLARLEALNIACDSRTLDAFIGAAFVVEASCGGEQPFALPHALLIHQTLQSSHIVWLPWDERRPDRVQQLQQRIEHNAAQWRQLRFDAQCVADLYEWLWQAEGQSLPLPAQALVRLEDLIARALRASDPSGVLAQAAQRDTDGHGPLLAWIATLAKLHAETQTIREAATAAGVIFPAYADVQPPKPLVRRDDVLASVPQAIFANPDFTADPEKAGLYLTRRDNCVLWKDWKGLEKLLKSSDDLFQSETGQFAHSLAQGLLCAQLLDAPLDALEHLDTALRLKPQSADALTAQARALAAIPPAALSAQPGPTGITQENRWTRWLANADARLAITTDAQERFALRLERALTALRQTPDTDASLAAVLTLSEQATPSGRATLRAELSPLIAQSCLPPTADVALLALLDTNPQALAPLYKTVCDRPDLADAQRPPLLRKLADLQLQLDLRPEAFHSLLRAIPLSNPQDPDFESYLSKTTEQLDALACALDRQAEALEALSTLHATAPHQALITQRYAQALIASNQAEQALPLLEALQQQTPDDTQTAMLLAEAYRTSDRLSAAIEAVERLQALLGPSDEAAALDDVIQALHAELHTSPAAALDYHRAHLQRDPTQGPTRAALLRLATPPTPPHRARSV